MAAFLSTLQQQPKIKKCPNLDGILQSFDLDQKLMINLDVGDTSALSGGGAAAGFVVKGMTLKLRNEIPNKHEQDIIAMPGINGPHPNLSSGPRRLDLVDDGHFVSMEGVQHVVPHRDNCAWEMVWKEDSLAGTILCGFELPKEYTRNMNSATLPEGRIYLSFPIWRKETLTKVQAEKEKVLERAQDYLHARDEAMKKFKEESNPIMKALYFREACSATEDYDLRKSSVSRAKQIPNPEDVIAIQGEELYITTKGLMWSKDVLGTLKGEQVLLGTANIISVEEVDKDE